MLVFERLNTGGLHLGPQELRNCLFSGDFNNLLIELARDPLFTKIWGIPAYDQRTEKQRKVAALLRQNRLYRRMQDCEIVLRYFALKDRQNIRGSVRSMLDRRMEGQLDVSGEEISNLKRDFRSRLKLAHNLFGKQTFRYKSEQGKWELSQTLYDGVMVSLDSLWSERERLLSHKTQVVARVHRLLARPSAFEVIIGRPNTASAVRKRMKLLAGAIRG